MSENGKSVDEFSTLDAAQEGSGELDLSQFASDFDEHDELINNINLSVSQDDPIVAPDTQERTAESKVQEPKAFINDSKKSKADHSSPKRKISGRTWFLVGMISLIVGAIGTPILMNIIENSDSDALSTKSTFIETGPSQPNVKSQDLKQINSNAPLEVENLKRQISELQQRNDKAFIAVKDALNAKDQEIEKLKGLIDNLQSSASTGGQKITEQSERYSRIEADQEKINSRLSKLESNAANAAKKAKAEHEKKIANALRAQYEVMTVITGKIRLRNANSGLEQNYSIGDELEGFGRIKEIAISGCITFDNKEKFEPIGANCKL